jgi:hypothetical protein
MSRVHRLHVFRSTWPFGRLGGLVAGTALATFLLTAAPGAQSFRIDTYTESEGWLGELVGGRFRQLTELPDLALADRSWRLQRGLVMLPDGAGGLWFGNWAYLASSCWDITTASR